MAKNSGNSRQTVVGIFEDQGDAQKAIERVQQQGYKARLADESSVRNLPGLNNDEAQVYLSRHQEGNSLVVVEAGDRGEDALDLLLDSGAEYLNLHTSTGQGGKSAGNTGQGGKGAGQYDANYYQNLQRDQRQYGRYDESKGRARTSEEMRVQLREETLGATKQAVQAGEVEVRKVVHEREQEIPVTLNREQVVIERTAVDRPAEVGEIGDMQDEVIRVPVYEEQAQLQKQARVREEVNIGKESVQEQQTLRGTVRHEHAEVVNTGDVDVVGDTGTSATTGGTTNREGGMQPYDTDR